LTGIKDFFGAHGESWITNCYSSTNSIPYQRIKLVEKWLSGAPDFSSVFDFGCGDGRLSNLFSDHVNYFGFDRSNEMLELAKQNLNLNRNFILHDIYDDSFNFKDLNTSLDEQNLILMMGLVHYLDFPSKVLSNLLSTLTGNATVYASFRNRLFNINSNSNYRGSELTLRDKNYLEGEISYINSCFVNNNELSNDFTNKLIDFSVSEDGVNDLMWNPNALEFWRQFSLSDAVKLMSLLGFKTNTACFINKNGYASPDQSTVFVLSCSKIR